MTISISNEYTYNYDTGRKTTFIKRHLRQVTIWRKMLFYKHIHYTLNAGVLDNLMEDKDIFLPYLRPLSDITFDKEKEYNEALSLISDFMFEQEEKFKPIQLYTEVPDGIYTFFNSHHFDYRGLIPIGLALKATKDMY